MADDFYKALGLSFQDGQLHIDLSTGSTMVIPLTPKLKKASRQQRNRWELVSEGTSIYWPEIDEFLCVDEIYRERLERLPLMRECRFCGERSRWNSNTCDNCGKERWNDPDDTDLRRTLGQNERENYEVALAAVRLSRAEEKLTAHDQEQPDDEEKIRH